MATEEQKDRLRRLFMDGSMFIAVFNCRPSAVRRARAHVVRRFGVETYNREVRAKMRTGIMEIFHHAPTAALKQFVFRIGVYATRASARRKAAKRKAVGAR